MCFGGRGGVGILLQEALCTVHAKVQKAARQEVRVRAGGRGRGVLPPALATALIPIILLQGQQWEGNHTSRQRRQLSLATLAVVLPRLEGRNRICRRAQVEDKSYTTAWEALMCSGRHREENIPLKEETGIAIGGSPFTRFLEDSRIGERAWTGEVGVLAGWVRGAVSHVQPLTLAFFLQVHT